MTQDAAVAEAGAPGIAGIDVFSHDQPLQDTAAAIPEIPPMGFIPPGSGPGSRRARPGGRPPRLGSPADKSDPPHNPNGGHQPAVVEALNPGDEELAADRDDDLPASVGGNGSPDVPGHGRARKRRRFPFLGLLLAGAIGGAAGAAAWFEMPHSADLRASMRFEKLDQLSGRARWEFEQAQHQSMETDEFRQRAQEIYQSAFNGRPGNGFLYRGGADSDFSAIIADAHAEGDRLVFNRTGSSDPSGDRQRFQALLKALYAVDLPMRDDAASRRATLEGSRAEFARTQQRLVELEKSIDDGQKMQSAFEAAGQAEKVRSDRSAKLERVWSDASANTRKLRAGVDELEAAPAAGPAMANDDGGLQRMTARLKQLNDTLEAARGARGTDAKTAAAALDAALAAYQAEIDKVKAVTTDGSALGNYLAVARQVEAAIHQTNADLADREKAGVKTISDLHGTIAEKIQAHLRRAWDNDPQLSDLKAKQDVQEHRLGAAAAAGMIDDAARIRVQLEVAKAAVATRRDQIALAASYPDEIKSLQAMIADQTEQMAGERARSEQRTAEQFKLLAAAAPAPGALPDDQQKLMDGLVDSLVAVKNASEQLALASGGRADLKPVEAEATDLRAQIEARRRQLAEVPARAAPAADSPALAQWRAALETAQQTEARAFADWTSSKADLAQAQAALDRLQSTLPDLVRDRAEYAAAQTRHDALKVQLEQEAAFVPVIPVDPDHEDAVQITRVTDKRMMAEIIIGSVFALTALVMLIRGGRQEDAASRSRSHRGIRQSAGGRQALTAG